MAINTLDQLYAAISAGQTYKTSVCKQLASSPAYTAGRWYCMNQLPGNPPAEAYATMSASTSYIMNSGLAGWMPTGGTAGAVGPTYTKYLVGMEAVTNASAGLPIWIMLCDMLFVYPSIPLTAATVTLINNVTLQRYTTGAGVQMFLELFTSTSNYGYTGTLAVNYNNSAGSPVAHNTSGTINCAAQASAQAPVVLHSGTAAGNYAPFLPLASGDSGITLGNTVTIGTGAATTVGNLILCKPLATIPVTQQYYPSSRDFVFNMPNMPVIQDDNTHGAYLGFLVYVGGALAVSTDINVTLDFVWG